MHFQPVDHIPDGEFGWWRGTLKAWHDQGLPPEIATNERGDFYFGLAVKTSVPTHHGLIPGFERKTISDDGRNLTYVDGNGVLKTMNYRDEGTIPRYLKFPVESREDWEEFKHRLDPASPERHRWEVDEMAPAINASEDPVTIHCGSLFGWIRNWVGFENLAMATIDDPDWVEEMVDYLADFLIAANERWYGKVRIDNAHFWEDIAFNNGPMVSPAFFDRVVVPRYKRITDQLKEHGTDVVSLDCDGNIMSLTPLWIKGGVNTMFPIEIRAGSDPLTMRELYGHDVLLSGGVDKMALIAGKPEILDDIKRLDPLIGDGGFIPHVDHRVPPDVTLENYRYYLAEKRAWLGVPEPAPYEERLAATRQTNPERLAAIGLE